jgi:class 3 adenylate cyclase
LPSLGVRIRAGVHTGEVEIRGSDLGGLAVHIAARIAETARESEVLVSSTVNELLAGSGVQFEDRGEREPKGIPETWRLYRATASR